MVRFSLDFLGVFSWKKSPIPNNEAYVTVSIQYWKQLKPGSAGWEVGHLTQIDGANTLHEALYFPKLVLAICSVHFQEYCCVHSIKTLAHHTRKCKEYTSFRTHNNFVSQLQWFFNIFTTVFLEKSVQFCVLCVRAFYIQAKYTILEKKEERNLFNRSIPSSSWVFLILICCQVNQVWTLGEPSLFTWSSLSRLYMYLTRCCFIEENIVSRAQGWYSQKGTPPWALDFPRIGGSLKRTLCQEPHLGCK